MSGKWFFIMIICLASLYYLDKNYNSDLTQKYKTLQEKCLIIK